MTITAYHYSHSAFKNFDLSKCDGFWFTDIAPENEDMSMEIGAAGMSYVAVCELDVEETLIGGENYDVEEQLNGTEFDALENRYDGFTDYALIDDSKIKIVEWVKL